jgi:hypothetical protein
MSSFRTSFSLLSAISRYQENIADVAECLTRSQGPLARARESLACARVPRRSLANPRGPTPSSPRLSHISSL